MLGRDSMNHVSLLGVGLFLCQEAFFTVNARLGRNNQETLKELQHYLQLVLL